MEIVFRLAARPTSSLSFQGLENLQTQSHPTSNTRNIDIIFNKGILPTKRYLETSASWDADEKYSLFFVKVISSKIC